MKNEKGITLIALTITIIVMLILAGITLNSGIYTVSTSQDNIKVSALEVISHAVSEQYIKGMEYNVINVKYDVNNLDAKPELLIGTIVQKNELPEEIQWVLKEQPTTYFYECYYKLDAMALKKLNVDVGVVREAKNSSEEINANDEDTSTGDEYIVNYMTGEVYNCTLKVTSEGKPLYFSGKKMGTVNDNLTENEDYKNSFTD